MISKSFVTIYLKSNQTEFPNFYKMHLHLKLVFIIFYAQTAHGLAMPSLAHHISLKCRSKS